MTETPHLEVVAPVMERKPKRVTILGMGQTGQHHFNQCRQMGRMPDGTLVPFQFGGPLAGEIWGINLMGIVFACDRVIQMNDATKWADIYGDVQTERFRRLRCPIYTAQANPEFPTTVDYPLKDVIETVRFPYLNNSVAYAIALAIHEGATEIVLFGCDFSYADPNLAGYREDGKGCVEFWIALAMARGIQVILPEDGTLLDIHNKQIMYGYFKPAKEVLEPLFAAPEPVKEAAE